MLYNNHKSYVSLTNNIIGMQFKHPEFLYALFVLIIPILIHLFQLRRFKKVLFSNVQFLKKIDIQSRKSSQIKKWLTLFTRILLLSFLIIAFTQPFFASKENATKSQEIVVYLDNSFSMQAKGSRGPLLQRSIQELISHIPEQQTFSLFTNNTTYRNITIKDIQNDLLGLSYSPTQLAYPAVYLKAKRLFSNTVNSVKRMILISDFQQQEKVFTPEKDSEIFLNLVQVKPETSQNIAIDSIYISSNKSDELLLNAEIATNDETIDNISVALYDRENLIAKTGVDITPNKNVSATFLLPKNKTILGSLVIEDPAISFDNTRYFSINPPKRIKVLAINEADDQFIRKVFTEDEFDLTSTNFSSLNYNDIDTANFVLINEIKQIPASLNNTLKTFMSNGGIVCFIPSDNGNLNSYRQFLQTVSTATFLGKLEQEKKITSISFNHPLYDGVFDKKISNFQYPKVNSFYEHTATNTILGYEDATAFLFQQQNLFVFTAALNSENSNFKNAPLIVPTLYRIAKQSLTLPKISYRIGITNTYDVATQLQQDEILSLVSNQEQIIPLQQTYNTKVKITTVDNPTVAGTFSVQNKDNIIQYVSYNYDQSESNLHYQLLVANDDYTVNENVTTLFNQIKQDNSIDELWKWFVIFALIFLFIEILLLKHLK